MNRCRLYVPLLKVFPHSPAFCLFQPIFVLWLDVRYPFREEPGPGSEIQETVGNKLHTTSEWSQKIRPKMTLISPPRNPVAIGLILQFQSFSQSPPPLHRPIKAVTRSLFSSTDSVQQNQQQKQKL